MAQERRQISALRRSEDKDFAAGEWETGSGRLDQGEGFADAVRRESMEELAAEVRIECILGTTHFYRGDPTPENDMVGVSFGCSVPDESDMSFSSEHSEHRWMTAAEAAEFLPDGHWLSELVQRAEVFRRHYATASCVSFTGVAASRLIRQLTQALHSFERSLR